MSTVEQDPYLWLEEVEAKKALDWAKSLNQLSKDELTTEDGFNTLEQRLLDALDSKERIPGVTLYGDKLFNYWRDDAHPKGIWRCTSLDEYLKPEPTWEIVLDLDQLSASENENWVWKGATVRRPDFKRCLMRLSRGGADATVVREFDLETKSFIENGFILPEAKSRVSWIDKDSVYVGTDFGPDSMTDSGYPRLIKLWKRSTPLKEAKLVFVGKQTDVSVGAGVSHDHGHRHEIIERSDTFWTNESFIRKDSDWVRIDKPNGAELGFFNNHLLLTLRKDWEVDGRIYKAGSLLAKELPTYLEGDRSLEILFEPNDRTSLDGYSSTKNWLIINVLDNVRNRLFRVRKKGNQWIQEDMASPGLGTVNAWGMDSEESDQYWMSVTDFLTPSSLYLGNLDSGNLKQIKAQPVFFKSEDLKIEQLEAISKDGTRVPYFMIRKKDLILNGKNPTLLYGYGGFEISMLSSYRAITGISWLEQGGVYVLANIRGGGEFGPRWHQSALKENRQRAYDDFIAIGEHLIDKKVTSARHLGIRGGSNGGLLMGNMLVQRPDLFRAVVCQVPLLDMKRFNKLLAGASWMGEYGNPDIPEEWAFLQKFSPYQLVKSNVKYP
ncbi:MAG: S9 family peptidase, partial [Verrucomicrobia bacterium]|nr:S9 family peptidase [Verrucomicrobiota bacterium]